MDEEKIWKLDIYILFFHLFFFIITENLRIAFVRIISNILPAQAMYLYFSEDVHLESEKKQVLKEDENENYCSQPPL